MHITRNRAGVLLLSACLLSLLGAEPAQAAPMRTSMAYETTGGFRRDQDPYNQGFPLHLEMVENGVADSDESFRLFDIVFKLTSLPAGFGDRRVELPFEITYRAKTLDGNASDVNESSKVSGWISGIITESGSFDLSATFHIDSPQPADPKYYDLRLGPPFQIDGQMNVLKLDAPFWRVPLTTTGEGRIPIMVQLEPVPTPEPAPVVLFAVAIAGFLFFCKQRKQSPIAA